LEPNLCFSTLVHVGKIGVRFQTFLKKISSFHRERGQAGPKWVWNLAFAFPLWSMLEKWGQVPNPLTIILFFVCLKGAKLVPKAFGTSPLLFHFGSCWKNGVKFQNLFKIMLAPLLFNFGPCWKNGARLHAL